MKNFLILFSLLIPQFIFAANAYEDQTKYLMQNDAPMNRETAEAHMRTFKAGPRRTGPGYTPTETEKPTRKLGNSSLDQCLKKKLNELIKKEVAASPEPSDPFAKIISDLGKELLLKGAISVEELDPAMMEECKRQTEAKGTSESANNLAPESKAMTITRNPRKDETCYSKDEYAEVFLFRRGGKRVTFKGGKEGDFKLRFGDEITINKDHGGIIEMKWPDGSPHKIILEPGSKIRIPCLKRYFNKATEQLAVMWALLEGTARFVTPPHRLAPNKYDIEANNSTAGIEGTDFIVQTSKTEDKISVIEGKVNVKQRSTPNQAPVLLSQNQEITITPKSISAPQLSAEVTNDLVKSYPDLFPEQSQGNLQNNKSFFALASIILLVLTYLGYKKRRLH